MRKAAHMWGWDILPRLVSAGIWRLVHLETIPKYAIEQLYYWTAEANPERAVLGAWFQVRVDGPSDGLVMYFEGTCGDHRFEYEWPLEFSADGCTIPIPNPQLWWPVGYGQPNLYTVTVQLRRGEQPDHIQFVPGLPKTRSGKIMRRILRKVAEGEYAALGDITTLADPTVVEKIVEGHKAMAGKG